jgi:hypothetical protein
MRGVAVAAAVALVAAALPRPAAAAEFFVFPIKVTLPVQSVIIGMEVDRVTKTTLKEKDVVNLALGRALRTKVDKKTEVLAVALTPEPPSPSALAKLVVFNPTLGSVTTVVGDATVLDYDAVTGSDGSQGQGTVTVAIQPTPGTPGPHALLASTLRATGAVKSSPLVLPALGQKLSAKGVATGRMSFRSGGSQVSGFVVDGKVKVSGKVLGHFSE